MRGSKTQDEEKFERYFAMVQEEAKKIGCVFFAEAGDAHEQEFETMTCEDLMGWLVPEALADQFEKEWYAPDFVSDKWDEDFYYFADWKLENGVVVIVFEDFKHEDTSHVMLALERWIDKVDEDNKKRVTSQT